MRRVWKSSPLLRILLPFAAGILLQIHVGIPAWPTIALSVLSLLTFGYVHFFRRIKYIHRGLHGFLLTSTMFSLGVLVTISGNPLANRNHVFNLSPDSYDSIELRLTEAPVQKEKSLKVVAEVIAVDSAFHRKKANGLLLFYIKNDSLASLLEVDDTIVVASKPNPLHEVQNPFEFNYKKYLQSHYIYNQLYAGSKDWCLKSKAEQHSFFGYFITWREKMLSIMRNYGVKGQEYAVLSALVLGKTSEIDYHLMLSYASAGAIHILAVSGLHVALIYTLLSPLMRRVFPRGRFSLVKTVLPVTILWLYAGVTGFSPSVLRAALMFSCFIVADNFAKTNNIYNTMSASALILLLWNPYIIMEVGFQLSYLAVLGIVVLQKKIDTLVYTRYYLLRKAWTITAVSISAQLSTFALGLLYFHQFPNWFLVSNLFVIPLSSLILFISLGFFAFAWCPPIASVLIAISNKLTWLMNESMLLIDKIPYSITQGISITVLESYLIAGSTLFFCYWLLWKKPKAIIPTLCCSTLLCITQVSEKTAIVKHREICIHSIPNYTCITYTNGENAFVVYNKDLIDSESRVRFHLKNYWDHLGIKNFRYINLDSMRTFDSADFHLDYPFMHINDNRFVFADSIGVQALANMQSNWYIFNESSRSVYLKEPQLEALNSAQSIFFDGMGNKKKHFLKTKLTPENVHDLDNGALIIRNKKALHFSAFY